MAATTTTGVGAAANSGGGGGHYTLYDDDDGRGASTLGERILSLRWPSFSVRPRPSHSINVGDASGALPSAHDVDTHHDGMLPMSTAPYVQPQQYMAQPAPFSRQNSTVVAGADQSPSMRRDSLRTSHAMTRAASGLQ